MLSRDEELALARRWRGKGDRAALEILCLAHAPLVAALARRYSGNGADMDDLQQEGNIGLLEAAKRFDPDRGVRFSTYARWWIECANREFVRRSHSVVQRRKQRGRRPFQPPDVSIAVPVWRGGPELGDTLADERPGPEVDVMERLDRETRKSHVRAALDDLTERERFVVEQRYLGERSKTLASLGEVLGVSKERVRQIERKGCGKVAKSVRARMADMENGVVA